MPVFQDATSIHDLAPHFGLTDALYPHIPEGEFRNILFLGWGADFENEFLNDCDFNPTGLGNIVIRADGQTMFKSQNPHETTSSKLLISFLS